MRIPVAQAVQQRVLNWARRRQGIDPDPAVLDRRRVYILPVAAGFTFGAMLFTMLLGAMNYSNSMGFMLTFLLAGVGMVAMQYCHRNLTGLRVSVISAEPVFTGSTAVFTLQLHNPAATARNNLIVAVSGFEAAAVDVAAQSFCRVELRIPTKQRGWLELGRISIATRYPLGLFRAWAWIYTDHRLLVYPAPADTASPMPIAPGEHGQDAQSLDGLDDFSGLRDYRPGDSLRHIAWKVASRYDELLVKQFKGKGRGIIWLDWQAAIEPTIEARLSRLCRWVLDAEKTGARYGLRIPGNHIAPGQGSVHCHRCLAALALYDDRNYRQAV